MECSTFSQHIMLSFPVVLRKLESYKNQPSDPTVRHLLLLCGRMLEFADTMFIVSDSSLLDVLERGAFSFCSLLIPTRYHLVMSSVSGNDEVAIVCLGVVDLAFRRDGVALSGNSSFVRLLHTLVKSVELLAPAMLYKRVWICISFPLSFIVTWSCRATWGRSYISLHRVPKVRFCNLGLVHLCLTSFFHFGW